jgi:hypothetical protein
MKEVILFLVGGLGGFILHTLTMKVSFKQRAIDNKIKVYDSLIVTWVKMRNFVYAYHPGDPAIPITNEVKREFDQIYGTSQQLIGEAILVCENNVLTADINELNERLYRTDWHKLEWELANSTMEAIKVDALKLVARMREDIKSSTRFEWQDFAHIVTGLSSRSAAKV